MKKDTARANNLHDLEMICENLTTYLDQSRRLLKADAVGLPDARELAAHVREIRLLLKELQDAEYVSRQNERLAATIYELQRRYLELEGIVKEIRNDLS